MEGAHDMRPGGWTVTGADDPHGDHRHVAAQAQPGHAGLALVEPLVRRPGPLGVDGQHAAALSTPVAVSRARCEASPPLRFMGICPAARKNQAVFQLSKYSALAT